MKNKSFDKNTIPSETDVLIIGAGPTGLALAITLQQAGIRHIIVDKLEAGLNTSRAAVIHAHTLDVLDQIGVAKELSACGVRTNTFTIRDGARALVQLHFDGLPSSHSYLLMLPQDETERILTRRLEALGGGVHRGVTAAWVQQNSDHAWAELAGLGMVRARYIVGGDGMNSIVRKAAGIDFHGGTFGESFVLADVMLDGVESSQRSEVAMYFSTAGMLVAAPLPSGGFRLVATVDEAPERPSRCDIQALLDARTGGDSRTVREVIWSSRFRVHHRLASAYRNGKLLLMGDAAHVHSPAGGQGMNTGMVDAVVLGQLLARAIADGD
jgi:2-polyprenyl-6-methoxyphenol hydroxylase-like FAD-dependent oxidoreductase